MAKPNPKRDWKLKEFHQFADGPVKLPLRQPPTPGPIHGSQNAGIYGSMMVSGSYKPHMVYIPIVSYGIYLYLPTFTMNLW